MCVCLVLLLFLTALLSFSVVLNGEGEELGYAVSVVEGLVGEFAESSNLPRLVLLLFSCFSYHLWKNQEV